VEKEYNIESNITQGGLIASIKIIPLADDTTGPTVYELQETIEGAGICQGIQADTLHQIVEQKRFNSWVTIARGEKASDGKDGDIEFHFSTHALEAKLKEDSSGRVNIKDMNLIQNVHKGDLLCELVPPKVGKSGITVKGEEIVGKMGAPAKLPEGNNVEVSEDGNKLFAGIDGMVVWADSTVSIEPVYTVDKVDSSTGNIRFNGSVVVNGEVGDGFEIHANDDVTVAMSVGRVVIRAGGDIKISGGILGQEKADISCTGNIRVKFIQDATIRVNGQIIVEDYIRNSDVTAGGPIVVRNPSGWIAGSTVSSQAWIYCHTIGNVASTVNTRLIIGHNPQLLHEKEILSGSMLEKINSFLKLQASLTKLRVIKVHGMMNRDQEQLYSKILNAIDVVRNNLDETHEKIVNIVNNINADFSGNIYIEGEANEGAILLIGKAYKEIIDTRAKTQYTLDGTDIVEKDFIMLPEIQKILGSD